MISAAETISPWPANVLLTSLQRDEEEHFVHYERMNLCWWICLLQWFTGSYEIIVKCQRCWRFWLVLFFKLLLLWRSWQKCSGCKAIVWVWVPLWIYLKNTGRQNNSKFLALKFIKILSWSIQMSRIFLSATSTFSRFDIWLISKLNFLPFRFCPQIILAILYWQNELCFSSQI